MKNRIRIIALSLTAIISIAVYFAPSEIHIEFLYSLIVLLTIWLPGVRSTFDTSIILTSLIILGNFLNNSILEFKSHFILIIFPVLFIWAFTLVIIKYKQSQHKLHRSTEHLNAMFMHAAEGIIISNAKGEIVMANPRAARQFGYEEIELVGINIDELVPKRFSTNHRRFRTGYYKEMQNRPMGHGLNLFAKRKDGSEFPTEISLSSFRIMEELFVISFIIDITERKNHEDQISRVNEDLENRVEQRTRELADANLSLAKVNTHLQMEMDERSKIEDALRDSERLYSTIARNFPDGVICVLDHELRTVFIDGKELQLLRLKRDELVGKPFINLPFWSGGDFIVEKLKRIFEWENTTIDFDFGQHQYIMTAVPLPDVRGIVKDILLVIQNVTELKKAEREILIALEKEKSLNEMKSKFVSIASHEFRTPLSTILSSLTLVEKYPRQEDFEKREKHILRIKSSVKNLTEILNDFLSLEKLEAGKIEVHPEMFDVILFAEDLTEELQHVTKAGQQIIYKHEGSSRNVFLDKHLLRNICLNLLNNAIKYSPENSPIDFISLINPEEVRLSVKDYGLGIPEEDQAHLFERFFRAANVTAIQGTGLGLNIVRRYVNLLKGSIEFSSQVNKGTTFTISFPIKPQQA